MSLWQEDLPYRTLPYCPSPWSDQKYLFAFRAALGEDDLTLPVIKDGEGLGAFEDGKWMERLLPIYDTALNFLSPIHYSSLKGALVEVSASVLYHVVEGEHKQGVYLQVREMQVLRPGRRGGTV